MRQSFAVGFLVSAFAGALEVFASAPEWQGRLDAPEWPDVKPEYYDHSKDPACRVVGAYFKGKFISALDDVSGQGKSGRKFMLRRRFTLKSAPLEAWLQGSADSSATFRINGCEAMKAWYSYLTSRNRTFGKNVAKLLKAGENELEIEYTVDATCDNAKRVFPGGAILELFVRHSDESVERIDSDASFESSADGKSWKGVVLSDPPPVPPRASRLSYRDFANPQTLLDGNPQSLTAKAGEGTVLGYSFKGEPPAGDFTVRFELCRGKSLCWEDEIPLSASNVESLPDGRWRIGVPVEVPLYVQAGEYGFSLDSNSVCIRGGLRMEGKLKILPSDKEDAFAVPAETDVRMVAGWPVVHMDGKPFPLMWGAVARNRRPDRKPRHGDMPLNAVTVYAHCDIWHPRHGTYDFAEFDLAAEKCRRENPEAYFVWDLSVYPPKDFAKRHPDQMSSDDEGDIAPVGRFSWSYASRPAMDEIKEMIERAIRHVESSPYANRIIGYRVNSGVTIEWLGWTPRHGHVKDFSEPNKAAFARFAAERYPELENPHVPSMEERQELDAPGDILWNRSSHLNAIAYMEYSSWIIARDVLEACGHAKNVLRGLNRTKLVGTYYGYTHFLNSTGRDAWRGHFALGEMLKSNAGRIDFLMSPQSYSQRRLGDTCGEMKPFASIAAAGIVPVIENDVRTHNRLFPRWHGYHQTANSAQTEAIAKRDLSIALCRCSPPYLYALASGLEFDSPECSAAGAAIHKVQRFCMERNVSRNAEVALVASEKSVCATPSLAALPYPETGRWTQSYRPSGRVHREPERVAAFHGEVFGLIQTKFARVGVPVDCLLAESLDNHPGDYKVYVFLNQFVYDAKVLAAVEKLRERGATILWLYAPGWGNRQSLSDMEELTGMRFASVAGAMPACVTVKSDGRSMGVPSFKVAKAFYLVNPDEALGTYPNGKPGLAVSRTGKSLSFFSGAWQLDVPFIRMLVKRGRAHIWCDSDDPVEANDALFVLHARSPGRKNVRLPRKATVVDVFGRRIVARDSDAFSFEAGLHSSHLFYFGPDAEILLKQLEQP